MIRNFRPAVALILLCSGFTGCGLLKLPVGLAQSAIHTVHGVAGSAVNTAVGTGRTATGVAMQAADRAADKAVELAPYAAAALLVP